MDKQESYGRQNLFVYCKDTCDPRGLCYAKNEVDKVIDNMKDKYMELEAENVKNIRSLALCKEKLKVQTSIAEEMKQMAGNYHTCYAEAVKDLYEKNKAIRRQKYKRCLTMSWYCESLMREAFLGNPEYIEWLDKWRERWLKIAEKFKEKKMMKCGRCGAEIKDYKCSTMSLTPQYNHSVWENRWMLLCEKCSAGLVQWLASGDPIQARINQEEAQ